MIRRMLKQHRIPTPSYLMAGFVAMHFARQPADPDRDEDHFLDTTLTIKLKDGRKIEVVADRWYTTMQGARQMNEHGYGPPGWFHHIRVGLPGPPKYRSVDLNGEEMQMISDEIDKWRRRSADARRLRREGESQEAALEIIEGFIGADS